MEESQFSMLTFKNDIKMSNEYKDIYLFHHLEDDIDDNDNLKAVLFPIYYFFDGYIDSEIGSSRYVRTMLRSIYQLDEKFDMITDNIIDILNHSH